MPYNKCFKIPDGGTVLPLNDYGILMQCAGIFAHQKMGYHFLDDNLVAEVVFSNSNAIDYLSRFSNASMIDAICSSNYARVWLGRNNYAFDTLWAASSTWRNNIFEYDKNTNYMLNVTVPTMTGGSTPSGQASANNSVSGYPAWKAFDGDDETAWRSSTQVAANATANGWLRYDWGYQDSTVKKRILAVEADSNDSRFTFTYLRPRYSDDGSTWTEACTPESDVFEMTWADVGAHRMWQLNHTMKNGATVQTYCPRIATMQFYGREDV